MEDPDEIKMTFTDSDSCTSYEVPSKAYPRFRFVQDRLQSFCPRFLKTVEKLPKGLKWVDLVNDIGNKVKPLVENMPEVILFGQDHILVPKDSIVANKSGLEQMGYNMTRFSRMELLSRVSTSKLQVLVYKCAAEQVKQMSLHLEMELSTCGFDNVLLLPDVGGLLKEEAQVLLEEVVESIPYPARDIWRNKVIVNISDEALSTGISNILEMRVVREFQRICDCINELLLIRRQFRAVVFEKDYLVLSLNKGILQNTKVVQDLMHLANKEECSDQFMFIQEQIINFIERDVARQFSALFKIATGHIHTMLEDIGFREECQKQISATTSLSIQSELSEIYMENQTFDDENLMETGEVQSEIMPSDFKPPSAKRKHRSKRHMRRSADRAKMLIKDLHAVLNGAEKFVRSVRESLTILSQLLFEVKGILSSTIFCMEEKPNIWTINEHIKTEMTTTEKQKTEDPYEIWIDKLMSFHEVQGCGEYFGNLIIFISNPSSAAEEQKVVENIAKCLAGCPYDYDVKIASKPFKAKMFADRDQERNMNRMPAPAFKAGQRIRFQGRSGTLGLFVHDTSPGESQSVYLITSGHVVAGIGQVHVIADGASSTEIGSDISIDPDRIIDIAAVKVEEHLVNRCILKYEDQFGDWCSYMMLDTSKLPHRTLTRKTVFKRGAKIGLTFGIISSENMRFREGGVIKRFNMVINPLSPGDIFAEEGDSGSVVSLCIPEADPIFIIAMLVGGMFEPRPEVGANVRARCTPPIDQITEQCCLVFSLIEGVDLLNASHALNLDIAS